MVSEEELTAAVSLPLAVTDTDQSQTGVPPSQSENASATNIDSVAGDPPVVSELVAAAS